MVNYIIHFILLHGILIVAEQLNFPMDTIDGSVLIGDINGTLEGNPTITEGIVGNAINLTPKQGINYGNQRDKCFGNIELCSNGYSISVLFKPDAEQEEDKGIVLTNGAETVYSYGIAMEIQINTASNNRLVVTVASKTYFWKLTISNFPYGLWYHVVVTTTIPLEDNRPLVYINGQLRVASTYKRARSRPDDYPEFVLGRSNRWNNDIAKSMFANVTIDEIIFKDYIIQAKDILDEFIQYTENQCGPVPSIANGVIIAGSFGDEADTGSTLTFVCDAGFLMSGSDTVLCDGGAWIQPPKCINADQKTEANIEATSERTTNDISTTESNVEFTSTTIEQSTSVPSTRGQSTQSTIESSTLEQSITGSSTFEKSSNIPSTLEQSTIDKSTIESSTLDINESSITESSTMELSTIEPPTIESTIEPPTIESTFKSLTIETTIGSSTIESTISSSTIDSSTITSSTIEPTIASSTIESTTLLTSTFLNFDSASPRHTDSTSTTASSDQQLITNDSTIQVIQPTTTAANLDTKPPILFNTSTKEHYKRAKRKIYSPEEAKHSISIGSFWLICMICTIGSIVLLDFPKLFLHLRTAKRNCFSNCKRSNRLNNYVH
ncbi:unnamed protein product [Owenia fusiformis]|uniref:Sushi domain-containing protein n=1 Tax=Owenia fusiformis TaxID=6347 RepID=A0A8S4P3G1_OWEFU|nr:unnamed protein product [Owenia fusiformis]